MFGTHTDEGYAGILDGIRIKTLVRGKTSLMAEFRLSAGARLPEHEQP